jgi:Mn-dependent DtxR family transcriptional regulator
MTYTRSHQIERRLQALIGLVRRGRQSTASLAKALNVSKPTVSRCLSALRERGYSIRAVKGSSRWSYELSGEPTASNRLGDEAR